MKKFQFLLLDAGPIITLFELGIWDEFLKRCDVSISQTVADEAKWASQEFEDVRIDLESYKDKVNIFDIEPSLAKSFLDKFNELYKAIIHAGEKETLAYLCNSSEQYLLCSGDKAVCQVLGLLGRGEQSISLEEVLDKVGLSQSKLGWQYTKKFREIWIHKGQTDSIQNKGFI
jgi:hypothetical protein